MRLPEEVTQMYALVGEIQAGLPLVERPYKAIGQRIGMGESEVIALLNVLLERGIIKRLGIVVRHHELGYRSNAMVVWDVPDEMINEVGRCFAAYPFVTLCYQRPRRLPEWPYNLFTMIHGRDRQHVTACAVELSRLYGRDKIKCEMLFSKRRYKQRGAYYCKKPVLERRSA